MADLTIYLGNKNYSSWSLRPWLALKEMAVPFDEVVIPLYQPESRNASSSRTSCAGSFVRGTRPFITTMSQNSQSNGQPRENWTGIVT